MKVILTENIEKVGNKGDVVKVKHGYARNYLVPRKFAIYATPQNLAKLDNLKKQFADEESRRLEQFRNIGNQISRINLTFVRKTDEHDNMYGSVSETDILHELQQNGIDISKSNIQMDKHIKQLGSFEVNIRLHREVIVVLHGIVEKETSEKEVEEKQTRAKAKEENFGEPVEEKAAEEVIQETEPVIKETAADIEEDTTGKDTEKREVP